jgi:hypothetical protein
VFGFLIITILCMDNPYKMKTIGVFLVLFVAVFTGYSQTDDKLRATSKSDLKSGKISGEFVFNMPSGVSKNEINESAEYYTMYFLVEYIEKLHQVKIKMKTNDEKSRHVILRFFVSLNIRQIELEGEMLELELFYQNWLR